MIKRACEFVGLAPATVTWVDDLAIAFPICEADQVFDTTARTMSITQAHFEEKGLVVNFKRGKSEAVATICGQNSREQRQSMMTHPSLPLRQDGRFSLRLEGAYRHLGTFQECGGGLGQEITYRISSTWASFKQVRQILSCQSMDLQVRLRLMHALLISKLLYGAGAWGCLKKQQIRRLHGCYLKLLRIVVGKIQTKKHTHSGWTDDRILNHYRQPCIRTLLAVARLSYAKRVWTNGGALIQDILNKEELSSSTSWMTGVREDLQWLYAIQGKSWGDDFSSTSLFWIQKKRGWKAFVRGAQRKHVLQEAIAYKLSHVCGTNKAESRAAHEQDEGWLCACGA